jgi:hypothetical protein
MRLSDSVRAIADATGLPFGRVNTVARRLQEIDAIPLGRGGRLAADLSFEQVALILLAALTDAPRRVAARIAADAANYTADGETAVEFIGHALRIAADSKPDRPLVASLGVHLGDRAAVVLELDTADGGPLVAAFTKDGEPYSPGSAGAITASLTLPGIAFDRLGAALATINERK